MTEQQFWQLVTANDFFADPEIIADELKSKLTTLDNDQLAAFDKLFSQKMRLSYEWSLWGAAYVIAGCNSEYGFSEFRCWLISRGQTVFETCLAQADNLADFDVVPVKDDLPYPFLDEYDLIAGMIYESRTEDELPFVPSGLSQPRGKRFKDKSKELKKVYPKLYQRFWTQGQ
ncbi:DUF4240 domain-containing protein [Pseudoalteromonas tunicata]|jgi:hypothetical protein|uniref:DUF4240 domain-containing protein n=1 Tax=Pseudoalteromonas tunicata D2 TaxID=87626 RepID=A4CAQ1_9GAMM|nr:DUF4240 domain-containing protein [Pseudoalteromonas tunicata]ATC95004.1 hypothetical protein PTUN_a2543 [Pseudoalteromonas tunicata]AXT30660.1 DUF4240 domain-containing protein [Pseudoalteromonas tunicata]EAR28459.1 hypothetical protein PTD2_21627 [Pseudoalteromonas tunicata D2]